MQGQHHVMLDINPPATASDEEAKPNPYVDISVLKDAAVRSIAFSNGRADFRNNTVQRPVPQNAERASMHGLRLYRESYYGGWNFEVHLWRQRSAGRHQRGG